MIRYARLWACALGAMAVIAAAAERVFPLNLATQRGATDKVKVQEVG